MTHDPKRKVKVGIVGCGFVGSTAAYTMVMEGIGRHLVLVDKNPARARAEAEDNYHDALYYRNKNPKIREFEFSSTAQYYKIIEARNVSTDFTDIKNNFHEMNIFMIKISNGKATYLEEQYSP